MHRLVLAALLGIGLFGTGCHHLFWHHHPPIVHRGPVRVAAAAIATGAIVHHALHHAPHRAVYVYHDCE